MQWQNVCQIDDILPYSGVAALIEGRQVAVFRTDDGVFAISNYDPFSQAYVLARGIVGDRKGVLKVASPIYKQSFSLTTGECLDDPSVRLPTYAVEVVDSVVRIGIPKD
jgi:nitrite reductase (NADH) small subunit